MAAKQARIERRVWDPGSQRFAATGEAMDGEVATLEQLADTLSRRRRPLSERAGPVAVDRRRRRAAR